MKKLGLYIHIPFCVQKCNYCDFNSYGNLYHKEDEYFNALFSEIKKESENYKDYTVDSVYIGGGTPTTAKTENIQKLLGELKNSFSIENDAEITIECNPKTATEDDFKDYLEFGINRLSIGLQSTHNEILKTLGRIHTLNDFEECLASAKSAGFKNISADLMFSLPGQNLKLWEETLNKVLSYDLSHISCYGLKIEKGTPFYKMKLNLPSEDEDADMYMMAADILKKNGFFHYEISNFARKNKMSKHNLKYWSLMPYIGLGAGAYSSVDGKRYSNVRDIDEYIKNNDAKTDLIELTNEELMSEFVFMGLRKLGGISEKDFYSRFGKDIYSVFEKPLEKHIKNGVLLQKNGMIYINEKMLYVSNLILCDFV